MSQTKDPINYDSSLTIEYHNIYIYIHIYTHTPQRPLLLPPHHRPTLIPFRSQLPSLARAFVVPRHSQGVRKPRACPGRARLDYESTTCMHTHNATFAFDNAQICAIYASLHPVTMYISMYMCICIYVCIFAKHIERCGNDEKVWHGWVGWGIHAIRVLNGQLASGCIGSIIYIYTYLADQIDASEGRGSEEVLFVERVGGSGGDAMVMSVFVCYVIYIYDIQYPISHRKKENFYMHTRRAIALTNYCIYLPWLFIPFCMLDPRVTCIPAIYINTSASTYALHTSVLQVNHQE